jgi:hypothetical protein
VKCCPLIADSGQRELHLSLGEPHGWLIGSERRKLYGHSRYLRRLGAVHCLHSPSGSRTPHRMFVVVLERAAASSSYRQDQDRRCTVMKNGAVSTGRRSGQFVSVAVTRCERPRSQLSGARSFSMQVCRSVLTRSLSK